MAIRSRPLMTGICAEKQGRPWEVYIQEERGAVLILTPKKARDLAFKLLIEAYNAEKQTKKDRR